MEKDSVISQIQLEIQRRGWQSSTLELQSFLQVVPLQQDFEDYVIGADKDELVHLYIEGLDVNQDAPQLKNIFYEGEVLKQLSQWQPSAERLILVDKVGDFITKLRREEKHQLLYSNLLLAKAKKLLGKFYGPDLQYLFQVEAEKNLLLLVLPKLLQEIEDETDYYFTFTLKEQELCALSLRDRVATALVILRKLKDLVEIDPDDFLDAVKALEGFYGQDLTYLFPNQGCADIADLFFDIHLPLYTPRFKGRDSTEKEAFMESLSHSQRIAVAYAIAEHLMKPKSFDE